MDNIAKAIDMNRNQKIRLLLLCAGVGLLAFLSGLLIGSSQNISLENEVIMDKEIIARVNNSPIYTDDLSLTLQQRASEPNHYPSESQVKQRLEEQIIEEVLYQEASRRMLATKPEIQASIRRILIHQLIDEEMLTKGWNRTPGEDEIRAAYESQGNLFNRPDQIRLAEIFIAVSPDSSAEEHGRQKALARSILAEAKTSKNVRNSFAALIEQYSDKPRNYNKGDTGFIDKGGEPLGLPQVVAEAGFSLQKNGDLYPQVIETKEGFHVVMRIGSRAAVKTPLSRVAKQLEQELRRDQTKAAREKFISTLHEEAIIEINDKALVGFFKTIDDQYGPRVQQGRKGPSLPIN